MIYKRPDSPFWFSDIRLPDGTRKRVSLRTTDKREAAKKAARLEDGASASDSTLGAALDAYTDHLSAHRRAWADGAKLLAKKTLGLLQSRPGYSLSPDLPLSRLSEAHLEALADSAPGGRGGAGRARRRQRAGMVSMDGDKRQVSESRSSRG